MKNYMIIILNIFVLSFLFITLLPTMEGIDIVTGERLLSSYMVPIISIVIPTIIIYMSNKFKMDQLKLFFLLISVIGSIVIMRKIILYFFF